MNTLIISFCVGYLLLFLFCGFFLFFFFFFFVLGGGGGGDYVLFIYDITASFKSSHQYMSPKLPVIFFVHQTEARFKILMSRKQNLEDIRILWWLSTRTNRICSYTLYMYMYLVLLLLQHKKICTTNNYASDDLIGRSEFMLPTIQNNSSWIR